MTQENKPYNVADDAAKLKAERQRSMIDVTERSALQQEAQQVSPSASPNRSVAPNADQAKLSEAVKEQWNLPQEQSQTTRASLQDVQAVGQTLKTNGVTMNASQDTAAKTTIENSFEKRVDNPSQSCQPSTTERIVQQARQAQQPQKETQSMQWGT